MLCVPAIVLAQNADPICSQILVDSLQVVVDQCTDMASDRLCAGRGSLELVPDDVSLPNEDVPLSAITSASTSAMDMGLGVVGTALIRLQSATQDQQAFLILVGDTTIVNQVAGSSSPFYDFRFETDSSTSGCDSIDAALGIYVPSDTSLILRINNSVFRVQGLITMQTVNANSLLATVHNGEMEIIGTGTVTAGNSVAAITNLGEILTWSAPRPINDAESKLGITLNNTLQSISGISLDVQSNPDSQTNASAPTCSNQPVHTVVSGDNLYKIGLQYGVTIDSIVAANELSNPQQIYPGQALVIPCGEVSEETPAPSVINQPTGTCGNGVVHTVQAGQTISQIAQGYGTTVDAITTANGIDNIGLIHVGDQLLVPCNTGQAPDTTNPPATNPTTLVQPDTLTVGFCETFFTLVPPGGYPQPVIDLYNQTCT